MKKIYFITFTLSIVSYIIYFSFNLIDSSLQPDSYIIVLSWVGILVGIYIIYTWYQLTGTIFSLYTIFVLFFFLFNYGQPLMWAVGIHQANEIGLGSLYTLGRATSESILYTQMLTIVSIIMFHLGAVFCYKPQLNGEVKTKKKAESENSQLDAKVLFIVSFILSLIVIPITFYNSITDLIYAQSHGYQALYHGTRSQANSLNITVQYMFFPVIVGLLIGSHYNKKIKYLVYIIFSLYLTINLLSGDRGSWIVYLIILIFMSHTFYKRISFKKGVLYSVISVFFLNIVNGIVSLRNTGISVEGLVKVMSVKENPIVTTIFEMGVSMIPTLILIQYGWDVWPYGNSYINSIIGVFSSKVFTVFNIPFETLSSWFSQSYLGISYGAGFSIIAEALINYGPLLTPLIMIIMGYLITSLTFLNHHISLTYNPLRIFFAVSTMSVLITLIRNHSHFVFKSWLYGVLSIFFLVIIIKEAINSIRNY